METVICYHKEHISSSPSLPHIEIGTCDTCGQVVQYDNSGTQIVVNVTQLGRIDGKVVIPNPKYHLLLSAEDKHDLDEAKAAASDKAEVAAPEETLKDAPKAPSPKEYKLLRKYREGNKEAMLRDYHSMRLWDFYKKWQLTSNTWTRLKKEWKVEPKATRGTRSPGFTGAAARRTVLPAFPEFKDSWPEVVQVRWFDTYRALVELIDEKG